MAKSGRKTGCSPGLWVAAALIPILLGGCGATLRLPSQVAVGQHFEAVVTREQRFSQGGDELFREQASIPVQIRVIEEKDDGFVHVWHYGCLKSDGVDSPRTFIEQRTAGLGTGLLLLEGLDLYIQTDEDGRPVKLLNRFQIRKAVTERILALKADLERTTGKGPVGSDRYQRLFYELESHARFYVMEANLQVEMEILSDALLLNSFNGEALPLGHRED